MFSYYIRRELLVTSSFLLVSLEAFLIVLLVFAWAIYSGLLLLHLVIWSSGWLNMLIGALLFGVKLFPMVSGHWF